ncbi:MAG: hypothetical protein H6502_03265 [Candidatus Woesearchaeota archaeon]|nr:MAG: hypothetical protein H6502_03265 [Candidatus Woesearchaeota archaeon]
MFESVLKEIGLTNAEIKIYLALLQKGPLTKTPLVNESKISGSKVYEVIEKLTTKGLISSTSKNNVKQFDAAAPSKIIDYLHRKKESIQRVEEEVNDLLPQLTKIKETKYLQPDINTFFGWEGLSTVFLEELAAVQKKTEVFIIGASRGKDQKKMELFFSKYGRLAAEKGLHIKILFNIHDKAYVAKIEENIGKKYDKRFLFEDTPTEITVIKNTTFITIHHTEPTVIRIRNNETADSFKQYFASLWQIAKK